MWIFIFGFIVLGWLILKNEKNFNKSIQTLEDRINQQQQKIEYLEIELEDLKGK
ncbi:hypothetical protein VXS72_15635 [Acinetobacter pittii]|uniref:hypothetical protein n=1 Tax=Acinetobacter pittii TaxID=48296 RepID=UPI002E1917FB|nr:hypothetical protein [Acinetobacter pittii]